MISQMISYYLFFLGIVYFIILFVIGVLITRWYAKKKEWDASYKPAIILNVIWLVVSLVFSLFMPYEMAIIWMLPQIIILVVRIIIGALVAMKLYKVTFGKALPFVIVILIILIIIEIALSILLY